MLACLPRDLGPSRTFNTWCGAHINDRKAALYWVSHSHQHLEIFLRSEDTPEIFSKVQSKLPPGVELKRRPHPRKGIAINTPLYFFVQTEGQAREMGPLLEFLSSIQFNPSNASSTFKEQFWVPKSEENDPEFEAKPEGNKITVTVSRYERDPKNRARCIQHYGTKCSACGFDFSVTYGALGSGYIHVHHLTPLSARGGRALRINPITDLRPVCPNCHEMLHRVHPPYSIDQLKEFLKNAKSKICL